MFLFPASIITLEKIFFLPTQKPCKIPYKFFPASNNLKLMLLTENIAQTIRNTLINLKYIFFLLRCLVPSNQTVGHCLESHSYVSGN